MLRRADVMELADMQDLGSCVERRGGSSPFIRTSRGVLTAFEMLARTPRFSLPELSYALTNVTYHAEAAIVCGSYLTTTPLRVCIAISGKVNVSGISIAPMQL